MNPATDEGSTALRRKAREAMLAGVLPARPPVRIWGGSGLGACCVLCGRSVKEQELEYEFELTGSDGARGVDKVHLHVPCYAAWVIEAQKFPYPEKPDGCVGGREYLFAHRGGPT